MILAIPERRIQHELMDAADPENARRCLSDLVRINRHFGGHAAIRRLLHRAGAGSADFSLLDIGAASGDTAAMVRQSFPGARVTSLDRNATNLAAAAHPKLLADAFQLPFRTASFDFVLCSLFLHHFHNDEVVRLIHAFSAIARHAVLILDLERHIIPYWFLRVSRPLFGWHWMTVHDGLLSVKAAFKAQELASLAARAGLRDVTVETHRPAFRLSLLARPAHGS